MAIHPIYPIGFRRMEVPVKNRRIWDLGCNVLFYGFAFFHLDNCKAFVFS
jgi:hypothetical protein